MASKIDRFEGDHYFLSNFYPSPIVLPGWHPAAGRSVMTLEHAFQSAKAINAPQALLVATSSSPSAAKRIGRRVLIRPGWDEGRRAIMLALLEVKFAAGTPLAGRLLDTGAAQLVEGNDWGDVYWGVDARTGRGANHLGLLIMRVRSKLAGARAAAGARSTAVGP